MEDLAGGALGLLGQLGGAGAGGAEPRGLLRLRQHRPGKPPALASEDVAPLGARHEGGVGATQVAAACRQNACAGGEDSVGADRPRRSDDHQSVGVPPATAAVVLARVPGGPLGGPLRRFARTEAG
jgi:hypothetical protein